MLNLPKTMKRQDKRLVRSKILYIVFINNNIRWDKLYFIVKSEYKQIGWTIVNFTNVQQNVKMIING